MDVALDRGQHDLALAGLAGPLHVRLEVADRGLHHLGRLQHERQLHLAGAEQVADGLHPVQQDIVDDLQGGPAGEPLIQVRFQADPLAVDDPPLQPLPQGQPGQLGGPAGLDRGDIDALEQLEQPGERVVSVPPAVVDQVERRLQLVFRYPGYRHDPGCVHDRRVQPGRRGFGQEHRVEHGAGRGVQAERDVGDPERRLHLGIAALQVADGVDGLDGVPPGLLLPGGDREREAVDDDVGLPHPPVAGQVLDQPGRHGQLPLGGPGLALLVDGEGDHRGAVLADERHDPGHP